MSGLIHRAAVVAGAAVVLLGPAMAAVATGTAAQAAPGACTTTGATTMCTYTGAGTYSFPVPSAVTSLDVTAVGAAGGTATTGPGFVSAGGPGASVEDTAVTVSAYQGQTLTVVVGGTGGDSGVGITNVPGGAGGSPGGGAAGGTGFFYGGAGGGGYSGLLGDSGTTALVIAAGGGGSGGGNNSTPSTLTGGAGDTGSGGGAGGGAGSVGLSPGCPAADSNAGIGCGGGGGTSTAGGTGGGGSAAFPPISGPGVNGSDGERLAGGPGAPSPTTTPTNASEPNYSAGGGGGGGYYGGGGGGSAAFGGGGGGGSSFGTGPGLTNEKTATGPASVTISYQTPAPDLSLTDTAPGTVTSGQPYSYALTASNPGGQDATGTVVTDTLPASVHYNSATTSQGSCTQTTKKGGTVTCTVGTLAAGTSVTITITVTPTKPGIVSDNASVTASNVTPPDPDDSASASVTVSGD